MTSSPGAITSAIAAGAYHAVALRRQAPALTATAAPTTGTIGRPYAGYAFAATGAPEPTFTVASGALPAGLILSPAGVLSGTPTTAGTATFTVQASNGVGTPTTSPPITIATTAAPVVAPPAPPPTTTSFTPPATPPTGDGRLQLEVVRLAPGDRFIATGGGYAAHTTVVLVTYSAPTALTTATTTDLGDVSLTATIPTDLPAGTHTLVGYGTAPDGSTRALTATITITALVSPTALPRTGTDLGLLLATALALLTAGTATALLARRRTSPHQAEQPIQQCTIAKGRP